VFAASRLDKALDLAGHPHISAGVLDFDLGNADSTAVCWFQRAGLCEKKHGAGSPRRVYRSKFEFSAALLQLCLCTACQVGPDHEVMKRPDRVEIGEAQGIVGMHNGCRDEQRAY
jgi:hypothetical protein